MKTLLIILLAIGTICLMSMSMLTPPPSNTDYLTSSAWVLMKSEVSPPLDTNDTTITDLMFLMDSCLFDDYFVFSSDSVLLIMDDSIKCDTNYIGPEMFIWHFDSTETYIHYESVFLPEFSQEICEILQLNADSFVIETSHFFGGSSYGVINTYTH